MYLSQTVSYGFLPSATSALQAAALTGLKSPFAKYLNWGTAEVAYMGEKKEVCNEYIGLYNYSIFMLMIEIMKDL